MVDDQVCKRLRKTIGALLRKAFARDLEALLTARGQELWLIGVDSKNKVYVDVCGSIGSDLLAKIQALGFIDADAGFKADMQKSPGLEEQHADAFLLNKDHFNIPSLRLEPLIVHELAHFLEQIEEVLTPSHIDELNSEAILKSLKPNIAQLHSKEWAINLAIGAKRLVNNNLTDHKTVRLFLEASIPNYDRDFPVFAKRSL